MAKPAADHLRHAKENKIAVVDKPREEWGPGHVTLWVRNLLERSVTVQSQAVDSGELSPPRELPPGQGTKFIANDGNRLTAYGRSKKRLASMVVDVSRGIVQDFMIGLQSDAESRDREEL